MSLLPLLLLGCLAGAGWALRRPRVLTVGEDERPGLVALHRHLARRRTAGLVAAGVAVLALLTDLGSGIAAWDRLTALGRGVALLPAVAGVCLLLGTVVGEVTARPAFGTRRSATLRARRVLDFLPVRLAATTSGGVVALAVLLVAGAAAGGPDDLGRPGRMLTARCSRPGSTGADGSWLASSSTGPWPGSYYAVPLALALAVVVAVSLAALAVIVRRPGPDLADARLDTMLRRHAMRNVLLAGGVCVFGTAGPVAGVMAGALGNNDCGPGWWAALAWLLGVGGLAAFGLAGWCALNLLFNPVLRVVGDGAGDRHVGQRR